MFKLCLSILPRAQFSSLSSISNGIFITAINQQTLYIKYSPFFNIKNVFLSHKKRDLDIINNNAQILARAENAIDLTRLQQMYTNEMIRFARLHYRYTNWKWLASEKASELFKKALKPVDDIEAQKLLKTSEHIDLEFKCGAASRSGVDICGPLKQLVQNGVTLYGEKATKNIYLFLNGIDPPDIQNLMKLLSRMNDAGLSQKQFATITSSMRRVEGLSLKKKFLNDLLDDSSDDLIGKNLSKLNGGSADAWAIARKHGDNIAKDAVRMERLSNDISSPSFPVPDFDIEILAEFLQPTAAKLKKALSQKEIYNFYKTGPGDPTLFTRPPSKMRKRYLEALTQPDVAKRLAVLKEIVEYKRRMFNLTDLEGNKVLNSAARTALIEKNVVIGEYSYVNASGIRVTKKYVAISGSSIDAPKKDPTRRIIDKLGRTPFEDKQVILIDDIDPINNGFRFYKGHTDIKYNWDDSESKVMNHIMNEIAVDKPVILDPTKSRHIYIDDVLNGNTQLKVKMTSEMKRCYSCEHNITEKFNIDNAKYGGSSIELYEGTHYYNVQLPEKF